MAAISDKNTNTCPICLDELIVNHGNVAMTGCYHKFHTDCIQQVIEYNKQSSKKDKSLSHDKFICPICRSEEYPEDITILKKMEKTPDKNIAIEAFKQFIIESIDDFGIGDSCIEYVNDFKLLYKHYAELIDKNKQDFYDTICKNINKSIPISSKKGGFMYKVKHHSKKSRKRIKISKKLKSRKTKRIK